MTTTPIREFPPIEEIVALAASEYERGFLALEYGAGLGYYLNRLDRLMLSGDALLDAGCGAGQWALAGSSRFARVEAIDVSPDRLGVLRALCDRMGVSNVSARQGSIEVLPYEPCSFDAVVCYGVMMFTDVRATLAGLYRVLKPGGRAYVCLNADGWSRYLIHERGKAEPAVIEAGRQTLYNTHWRRACAAGVEMQLRRAVVQLEELWPAWLGPRMRGLLLRARAGGWTAANRLARALTLHCLSVGDAGLVLMKQVADDCGPPYVDRLHEEVWTFLVSGHRPLRTVPAEAYLPSEFQALATAAGFEGFQWSIEAGLACDWLAPAPAPKYAGYHDEELCVWEAIFVKPDVMPGLDADVGRHLAAALRARDERLFLEPASRSVLSNASPDGYPPRLVAHAGAVAERMGGVHYLDRLARAIVAGADTDEARARRVIEFAQRSIFRDPISQPLLPDGDTPDPLTILLCARGRCSHTASLLVSLFRLCGFEARVRQLSNHVVAEALIGGRWIVADADAFKNGVIPVNRAGALVTMDDLMADPWQLDRFQPTGWWIRQGSRYASGVGGGIVRGYVDALDPDRRGFVSGYYVPAAKGAPPGIPTITRFDARDGRLVLAWTAARVPEGTRLVGYRVAVGSTSRGWSYDHPGDHDEIRRPPQNDVVRAETLDLRVEVPVPTAGPLFAAVTAIGDRIAREPDTYFWPSDEVSHGA